ncbi:MAG: hypothetical protein Q9159_003906 [Coniocarpon cinnabarinum]
MVRRSFGPSQWRFPDFELLDRKSEKGGPPKRIQLQEATADLNRYDNVDDAWNAFDKATGWEQSPKLSAGHAHRGPTEHLQRETRDDSALPGLFASNRSKLDPTLSLLFSASSGPIELPKKRRHLSPEAGSPPEAEDLREEKSEDDPVEDDGEEVETSAEDEDEDEDEDEEVHEVVESSISRTPLENNKPDTAVQQGSEELQDNGRKRKRKRNEDNLEASYFQKLADEEREDERRLQSDRQTKQQALQQDIPADERHADLQEDNDDDNNNNNNEALSPPPQHETLENDPASKTQSELDKAARTVFLANVSITAITSAKARKELLAHLSSHFSTSTNTDIPHKIESFRFRSTAYSSALPKKASFTRGELNEATSHSTNAYCVYSTKNAAREAARRLNGTIVLGRHLRVDEVAHPMKTDHRRCVFVGNLGFVDDETEMKAALAKSEHPEDKKKAQLKALKGDVEEGLWVQFSKAGPIESVRVVRDPQTRVGKGFAYVQFKDENAVESALLFNDKKFPHMLPRKLRVVRCKKPSQTALALDKNRKRTKEVEKSERAASRTKRQSAATGANKIKPDEQARQGRLKKMLGKAGVAEMRAADKAGRSKSNAGVNGALRPGSMVFEGHRATSSEGNRGLKLGATKRKKDRGQVKKRSERDKKRAAAYKTTKKS